MWLMAGIALVILAIIFFTGHAAPVARPTAAGPAVDSVMAATDRIRNYQQQLTAEQTRQQAALAQEQTTERGSARGTGPDDASRDPLADEQRRREYQSLFADNVAVSRRPAGQSPAGAKPAVATAAATPDLAAAVQQALRQVSAPVLAASAASSPLPSAVPATTTASDTTPKEPIRDEHPASGPRLRLLEGAIIETVLTNRLDGSLTGPVNGLVTNPVYAQDRQAVLIPAGARVLGSAAAVQSFGDTRLAVSFHRLVMPDGHTYSLDGFKGLDQIGETGLRDSVNHHYLQVFGASLAIGAISGLAQYNTASGLTASFGDSYRQAAGASLASSTARVLDRYLNVLPTITIREGFHMKVYLTNDLELPAYTETGGMR
jgi:type IV secretion system protein VirB10